MNTSARTTHVLIVGIDGVRYDTLQAAHTPALGSVANRGFVAPAQVDPAAPTLSGPGWSTAMTGVLAPDHGVFTNDLSTNAYAEHPDWVTATRAERPDIATFVGASWPPLVGAPSGGPLFAGGGFLPRQPVVAPTEPNGWLTRSDLDDEELTVAAEHFLDEHDGTYGTAAVVVLGAPDLVCHEVGVGEEYVASVEAADRRLARILLAIDARPSRGRELWTVILLTDHGHVDSGGHGGDNPEERTAWIAACSDGGTCTAHSLLAQVDVAASALAALGIQHDRSPALAGQSFILSSATESARKPTPTDHGIDPD